MGQPLGVKSLLFLPFFFFLSLKNARSFASKKSRKQKNFQKLPKRNKLFKVVRTWFNKTISFTLQNITVHSKCIRYILLQTCVYYTQQHNVLRQQNSCSSIKYIARLTLKSLTIQIYKKPWFSNGRARL